MINNIKANILQYRLLLENFSFLSVLQVSNLLIFLVITPYLFRVLGKENYGLVVFGQTIATYFSILVNFGFTVTATRDISLNRDNKEQTSKIISTVLTLKGLFFLLSLTILSALIWLIPLLSQHPRVFFFSMFFCLSETLFPIWYFQGIEKMKYIAIINIVTRVLSSSLILIFVLKSADYYKVPVVLGAGTVLGSVIGLFVVFRRHHHRFELQSKKHLLSTLKDNVPLFISNVSTQIYVNANKLIVGSFLGMQDVAIYDIADKIVNLFKVPVALIGQTLFPRISRDKDVSFVKKSMLFVFVFFSVVYTGVYLFANQLIFLFSGSVNPEAAKLLRLLALSLLPICLSLFFAELLLIPFGKLREYARMRTISMFIYLISVGMLIEFNVIGLFTLALTIVGVESFVFLYSYYLCKKNILY
ncbi:MAG: oligosaccharide flippase family protein [Bacteroidales bacterium]|nr:oligosaccharide flippase family protein [Bacteroidales bacterium]